MGPAAQGKTRTPANSHVSFSYHFGVPASVRGGLLGSASRAGAGGQHPCPHPSAGQCQEEMPPASPGAPRQTGMGGSSAGTPGGIHRRTGLPGVRAAAIWVIISQGFPDGALQGDLCWGGDDPPRPLAGALAWGRAASCAACGAGRSWGWGAGGLVGVWRLFLGVCCPPQAQTQITRSSARRQPGSGGGGSGRAGSAAPALPRFPRGFCWKSGKEMAAKSLVSKRALDGPCREALQRKLLFFRL